MSKAKDNQKHRKNMEQESDFVCPAGEPQGSDVAQQADSPATPVVASDAQKIAELEDQLVRMCADFDNFRRRAQREKNEIYEQATSDLMLELLPVLDHIQLGLQAAVKHKAFHDGLALIADQLVDVLKKYGLEPFDVEKKPFNPDESEAISMTPSDDVPEGHVAHQVRRGYRVRQRLLRPAQVIVSSGSDCNVTPSAGKGEIEFFDSAAEEEG